MLFVTSYLDTGQIEEKLLVTWRNSSGLLDRSYVQLEILRRGDLLLAKVNEDA